MSELESIRVFWRRERR